MTDKNLSIPGYYDIESRLINSIQAHSDIQAAVVIGSFARRHGPAADIWSDLDVVIFVDDPTPYCSDINWLDDIGDIWFSYNDVTAKGITEWHLLFAGMYNIEVAIISLFDYTSAEDAIYEAGLFSMFQRGTRILFEKNRIISRIIIPESCIKPPPSENEFTDVVYKYWIDIVRSAKKLCRGELYAPTQRLNCKTRNTLIQMIEWNMRAKKGWHHDTMHEPYGGRFVESWLEPKIMEQLKMTYSRYSAAENKRSLLISMSLFNTLGQETSGILGYPYPHDTILKTIFCERPPVKSITLLYRQLIANIRGTWFL